jgi:hypothetical protein
MMKTTALAGEFRQHDILFRFLDRISPIKPVKLALGAAILTFIVLWVELALAGMPPGQAFWIVSFQALVIFPLAILLYFAIPHFVATPFAVIDSGKGIENIDPSADSYMDFRQRLIATVDSPLWNYLALFMIVFYWVYRLFMNVPSDPSKDLPDEIRVWYRIALLIIYSPLLYMGVLTLCRLFVGLVFIGQFFKSYNFEVNPMHPDGVGGFRFVGQMLTTSALIATAFGAASVGLIYINLNAGNAPLERVEIILLGLIYLTLTPLLFYSLLWNPHQALFRAREKSLKPLAEEYKRISDQQTPPDQKNAEVLKAKTDHLVEIKRQYELIRDTFPSWPLDTRSLRNLMVTAVLPAISALFSGLISGLWDRVASLLNIK